MSTEIERRVVQLRASSTIEEAAHELRMSIWNNRNDIFKGRVPENPVDILEPGIALSFLGFDVKTDPYLGDMPESGRLVRVAGLIDREHQVVRISPLLTYQESRFTTAHELGHGVLHVGMSGLHRDRVVSGPTVRKDKLELDADNFASAYLMPIRLVLQRFRQCFGCDQFRLGDDTAFGLQIPNTEAARSKFRDPRCVSYALATASSYMGRPFESLARHFRVSPTAMAIRIEEVGLINKMSLSKGW